MNTETVLARILPAIEEVIKAMVSQAGTLSTPATLYELRGADTGGLASDRTGALARVGGRPRIWSRGANAALSLRSRPALPRSSAPPLRADQRGPNPAEAACRLSVC